MRPLISLTKRELRRSGQWLEHESLQTHIEFHLQQSDERENTQHRVRRS
jgi:hypothetical protein